MLIKYIRSGKQCSNSTDCTMIISPIAPDSILTVYLRLLWIIQYIHTNINENIVVLPRYLYIYVDPVLQLSCSLFRYTSQLAWLIKTNYYNIFNWNDKYKYGMKLKGSSGPRKIGMHCDVLEATESVCRVRKKRIAACTSSLAYIQQFQVKKAGTIELIEVLHH